MACACSSCECVDMVVVVIMDLNTGESTSVKYSTTYFAAFAFLTLEHTPAGNFASACRGDSRHGAHERTNTR